jgi:TM2 domain-containing membrane protein YozV
MKPTKTAFSKILLIQESILIWLLSLSFIGLAYLCVMKGFSGSLPWLSVTLTGAWTAYGVSQAMYYSKAKAENTKGGIVFETAVNPNVDCD